MIEIPLTQGQIALVDDIDADLLTYKWVAQYNTHTKTYYAQRTIRIGAKRTALPMHRVILSRMLGRELTYKDKCDHINHNTLDNRRAELRLATNSQNAANRSKTKSNTSGYKGVTWRKDIKKWHSQIEVQENGKRRGKHLGYYDDVLDAAKAYDRAALEHHKQYARINFPEDYEL